MLGSVEAEFGDYPHGKVFNFIIKSTVSIELILLIDI